MEHEQQTSFLPFILQQHPEELSVLHFSLGFILNTAKKKAFLTYLSCPLAAISSCGVVHNLSIVLTSGP